MMNRRDFLFRCGAFGAGVSGLHTLFDRHGHSPRAWPMLHSFDDLNVDPRGIFDLPEGFSYSVLQQAGDDMDDGLVVPAKCDGMASFARPDGSIALVCNHEITFEHGNLGAFGRHLERLPKVPPGALYDFGKGLTPAQGGTSTIIIESAAGGAPIVKRRFLSLAGTEFNCAGGPTPWGTWLTCEETAARAGVEDLKDFGPVHREKDHGYVFEVSASADAISLNPAPILAMGRFRHEAVAVDPRTGIVYLTEDRADGLIYRFLPHERLGSFGSLLRGGRLQMLACVDHPSFCTRNWTEQSVAVGTSQRVRWLDALDTASPLDDLRARGFAQGAARFARGEGMWFSRPMRGDSLEAPGAVYWACTNGGAKQLGQIWRYTPAQREGAGGDDDSGTLELIIEPNDSTIIENADNITVAPWGDLFVCEDGTEAPQYLLGITPTGRVYKLGRNALDGGELAGVNFSPDGRLLFVNLQRPGLTLAISGPWQERFARVQ